jgi:hypothetical protein
MRHFRQVKGAVGFLLSGKFMPGFGVLTRGVGLLVLPFWCMLLWTVGGCSGQDRTPEVLPPSAILEKELPADRGAVVRDHGLASSIGVGGAEVSRVPSPPEKEVQWAGEAVPSIATPQASKISELAEGHEKRPGATGETSPRPSRQEAVSEVTKGSENLSNPEAISEEETRHGAATREDQPPELGPPLVDHPERLQLLHPRYLAWIDPVDRVLVLVGQVCQQDVPLELFACSGRSKAHESVVWVSAAPYVVHAGLLALGAEAGSPVQFNPELRPPTGSVIEIVVRWQEEGVRREIRAQDWVQDISAMYRMFEGVVANHFEDELHPHDHWDAWRSMNYPWVFAGSQFVRDERTGREVYLADMDGELVCVANFASAVLDVPIESSAANAALMFRCFAERIPPIGTPVTLILRPASRSEGPPHQ